MQKTIEINGKKVDFKFTLAAFYIFKNQFGYDAMNKIVPMIGEVMSGLDFSVLQKKKVKTEDFYEMVGESLQNTFGFEMVDILNFIWAFAKCGNNEIGDPISWYSSFDEFPIIDVMKEFIPALMESLGSKKKLVKKNTEVKIQRKTKKQE